MPRFLQYTFAGIILGILIGVPVAYATWRNHTYRNFRVVREGVLYRSGQLPIKGLKRLIHDHNIKTVVTLRFSDDPKQPFPDLEEEKFCKHIHLRHHRLRHKAWEAKDKSVPAETNIKQFFEIMNDPNNHPVLVHCFAGVHRTGTFCALYRMEFEGWSNEDAIAEMKAMGYTDHHRDVFGYLSNYISLRALVAQSLRAVGDSIRCGMPNDPSAAVQLFPAAHATEPPIAAPEDR